MPDDDNGASEDEVKLERTSEEKKKDKVESRVAPKSKTARAQPAASSKVLLRSRWPGRLLVTADMVPSHSTYEFPKGGGSVSVAAEDVESLLARQRKSGCCGAGGVEPFFELV